MVTLVLRRVVLCQYRARQTDFRLLPLSNTPSQLVSVLITLADPHSLEMTSILREAATTIVSLISGKPKPEYEPVLTEDSNDGYVQHPVVIESASNTARQRAAKKSLLIVLINVTFLSLAAYSLV